jgi:hypothetical protein
MAEMCGQPRLEAGERDRKPRECRLSRYFSHESVAAPAPMAHISGVRTGLMPRFAMAVRGMMDNP